MDVQEGYMMKKIMMEIVPSLLPDRLGFSLRTQELYWLEILKFTGNLKEYEPDFKSTRGILSLKYI